VILPNEKNGTLINMLSDTYDKTPKELITRIREANNEFAKYKNMKKGKGTNVNIHHTDRYPIFSYYRFDNTIIFSLYSMKKNKGLVPHMVVKSGGTLFNFALSEYNSLLNENIKN
jgi:hypothetical protein